ncbi:MAG: hypothetical protein RLZ62_1966 [Bacteroidota bacterium]|jgi:hypothetical protein
MTQKSLFTSLFRNLILSGFFILCLQPLYSQIVPKISFQGVLKTASGEPVPDGEYTFTFSFWKSLNGTANSDKLLKIGATDFNNPSNQWSETVALGVAGGIYSHNLGSVTPLNPKNFEGPVYLNIKVGGKDILPRTEFTYAPFSFSVASAQKVVCSGAVGDIKYSILPPDKFKDVNGDCWVPLDGRSLANTDQLYGLGVTTLPNAGGRFLRAQDFSAVAGTESWKPRNSSNNDPDRDHNTAPGSVQAESFKAHNHTGTTNNDGTHEHGPHRTVRADNDDNDGVNNYVTYDNCDYCGYTLNNFYIKDDNSAHRHDFTTANSGGNETRPENLNFWIYIRIN